MEHWPCVIRVPRVSRSDLFRFKQRMRNWSPCLREDHHSNPIWRRPAETSFDPQIWMSTGNGLSQVHDPRLLQQATFTLVREHVNLVYVKMYEEKTDMIGNVLPRRLFVPFPFKESSGTSYLFLRRSAAEPFRSSRATPVKSDVPVPRFACWTRIIEAEVRMRAGQLPASQNPNNIPKNDWHQSYQEGAFLKENREIFFQPGQWPWV